jgi:peroxiredoxin family protein
MVIKHTIYMTSAYGNGFKKQLYITFDGGNILVHTKNKHVKTEMTSKRNLLLFFTY